MQFISYASTYVSTQERNFTVSHKPPQSHARTNKKLSYCWETVRRESMPRIAEMDVEITT